jgi:unsaturated rhamnogalacturonyl hydrolase
MINKAACTNRRLPAPAVALAVALLGAAPVPARRALETPMESSFMVALALGWLATAGAGQAPIATPSPADKADGVPVNVALSWAPGAASHFDVYFGTTNPPPFQCRVDRPSFVLETLGARTTYYWRVDEVAAGRATPGAVRRFTTAGKADRDAVYAWPIRIATSVRSLFPKAADLGNWNYTEGMIADALYRIAERTGRNGDITYVREYLDRFVSADGSLDPGAYPFELYSLDRIRPAASLLWMHDHTGEEKYMTAAKYVASQLDKQPRTSEGGYWHRSTYPNQMWLDGIYMADVYAVQFGRETSQPRYYDEAVRQITLVQRHTHDPKTGLYYHGWDETKSRPWADKVTGTSPEFWGRAIGWYAMAMADVMDALPADHPGRRTVLPIFQDLCRSLLRFQDRDTGMWFQIVDKPAAPKNYVETSSTLMFAYAMARGAERGWLPSEFLEHARRATRGVLNHKVDLLPGNRMDIRGTVQVGSLGGDGGFYNYYVSVPVVTNDQKSIGAFMFLSLALSEIANPAVSMGSALDDDVQVRVRRDYFNLLMGIHQTWHWLPDDA